VIAGVIGLLILRFYNFRCDCWRPEIVTVEISIAFVVFVFNFLNMQQSFYVNLTIKCKDLRNFHLKCRTSCTYKHFDEIVDPEVL
jgi:hypothetical protein